MIEFFAALIVFFTAHVIPAHTGLRDWAQQRLGVRPYLILYSGLSIALLGWVISASLRASYIPLWTPASWSYVIPIALMPFSFMLLSAAIFQPNPLSIAFTKGDFDPGHPGIVAITRHPILWGFGLWAGAHIPPNGDLIRVILFFLLALFAFTGMPLMERRQRQSLGQDNWQALSANTSIVPFAAILAGRASWPKDRTFHLALVIGLALYAVFLTMAHGWLFGVAPLAAL